MVPVRRLLVFRSRTRVHAGRPACRASRAPGAVGTAARKFPGRFRKSARDLAGLANMRGLSSRGRRDRAGMACPDAPQRLGSLRRLGARARRSRESRRRRDAPDVRCASHPLLGPGGSSRENVREADPAYGRLRIVGFLHAFRPERFVAGYPTARPASLDAPAPGPRSRQAA